MAKCLGECFMTYGGMVRHSEDSLLYEYVVCVYCGSRVDRLIPVMDTSKTPLKIDKSIDSGISEEFKREQRNKRAFNAPPRRRVKND